MEHYKLFFVTPFDETSNNVWKEALVPAITRINRIEKYAIDPMRADFELKGLEFAK